MCDQCGFRCAHNGNLKQHMKTHKIPEFPAAYPLTGCQVVGSETYPTMTTSIHAVFESAALECNQNDPTVSNSLVVPNAHHAMTNALPVSSGHSVHDATLTISLPMSSNLLPLSDHRGVTNPHLLAGNMLQGGHTGPQDNEVSSLHREMSVPNHQSPFHHSYAQCQNSHGQPT